MERLLFKCPRTGHDIDVGIESELDTLLRIRHTRVIARCPNCGEPHEWQVCEANLKQAASSAPLDLAHATQLRP